MTNSGRGWMDGWMKDGWMSYLTDVSMSCVCKCVREKRVYTGNYCTGSE